MKKVPPAVWILVGLVLGIIVGYMIFLSYPDKKTAAQIAGYVSILSDVFLRLIKMLIGPLVFSTLVVGIAHMGDAASVGRVFAKALGWFVTASIISLLLGMLLANLLQPGHNLGLPLPDIGSTSDRQGHTVAQARDVQRGLAWHALDGQDLQSRRRLPGEGIAHLFGG